MNEFQQKIFHGNQKLEEIKKEIGWNQEEKEVWKQAAIQKEQDKLLVEKYQKVDDSKIKDLGLDIEKLNQDKNQCNNDLNREI